MQRTLEAHGVPQLSLQDRSIAVHGFHCTLLERSVHFASHAADLCRHQVPRSFHRWAKQLHQQVAHERHEVYDLDGGSILEASAAPFLDVPSPEHAKLIFCADLEASLAPSRLASPFKLNAEAKPICSFSGNSHLLRVGSSSAHVMADLDASKRRVDAPTPFYCLVPPASHIDLDYNDFVFNLTDHDVDPSRCVNFNCGTTVDGMPVVASGDHESSPFLAAELDSGEGFGCCP